MEYISLDPGQSGHMIRDLAEQGILQATLRKFLAGEAVFEAAHLAAFLYLIETGEIDVYRAIAPNITRLTDTLGPGAWLGLAALNGQPTYGKRAVAIIDSMIWAISNDGLGEAVTRYPQLAIQILQSMAARLSEAWNQVDNLTRKTENVNPAEPICH